MLSLKRSAGERVRVRTPAGEIIWVEILAGRGGPYLGLSAAAGVEFVREELLPERERFRYFRADQPAVPPAPADVTG